MYFVKYEDDSDGAIVKTSKLYVFIIALCALLIIFMVVLPSIFIMISKNAALIPLILSIYPISYSFFKPLIKTKIMTSYY